MDALIVTAAGSLVLLLGVVSRRPWGRWWSGGGAPSEQAATLIAPPMGLALFCVGLDMAIDDDSFSTVMGFLYLPSLIAGIWVILSLPVPDRVLVKGSFIRADRRRRRQRRQERRERRRRGRAAD